MARQKCTFKWQDKSLRLNGKTKVYKIVRLNVFRWKDKSVHKWERQKCTFKWQDKSFNGKTKVNV